MSDVSGVLADRRSGSCLVVNHVSSLRFALLLSHLGLAEFSVDNGRADSEIRRLHGAEHSDYYRVLR